MYLLVSSTVAEWVGGPGNDGQSRTGRESAIASSDRPRSCARVAVRWTPFRASLLSIRRVSGSEFGVERLMDRCVERPSGPPPDARAVVRSFGTEQVRSPFDRSSGRLASEAVAAQSLVEYVRLAALCGLLRCEIAEDPKGNRRRRSMRRMPRELASGSSEKWRRPVSTGVSIPGSGPAADTDDRSADRQSQCILRTRWSTTSGSETRSNTSSTRCVQRCSRHKVSMV